MLIQLCLQLNAVVFIVMFKHKYSFLIRNGSLYIKQF